METVYNIIIYLVAINIIAFIMYGVDKWKAKNNKWRIPEKTLIGIALIGGSIGALAGMMVWRHKTQHPKFYIGVPAILIIQIALVIYFVFAY